MTEQIREEINKVLEQWRTGTPVRTLAIGHRTRARKNEHGETVHDLVGFRQHQAAECAFRLIEEGMNASDPIAFPDFQTIAHEIADGLKLSAEEYAGASSFAWVVLHRGWAGALQGHSDHDFVTVKKQTDA